MNKTLLAAGALSLLSAVAFAAQHTEDINITGNAKGLVNAALTSGTTGNSVSATVPVGGVYQNCTASDYCQLRIRTQ